MSGCFLFQLEQNCCNHRYLRLGCSEHSIPVALWPEIVALSCPPQHRLSGCFLFQLEQNCGNHRCLRLGCSEHSIPSALWPEIVALGCPPQSPQNHIHYGLVPRKLKWFY